MGEMALVLGDSVILPFDVISYAKFLVQEEMKIEKSYRNIALANGATFGNTMILTVAPQRVTH